MTELVATTAPRAWLKVWIVVAAAALVAAGVLWFVLRSPDTSRYQPLISAAAAGQFTPDQGGRVRLHAPYAGLTPHDEIFIRRRPDGSFLMLVPTFYPKGPAIAGLLYTSRPFKPTDTFNHGLGTDVVHPFIGVGAWAKLRIDSRVDDHWYKVSQGIE